MRKKIFILMIFLLTTKENGGIISVEIKKGSKKMKIYIVVEDIDDYPEAGGGVYPDAVFLNYTNAERYAKQKQREADNEGELDTTWRIETWETVDEK